MLQVAASEPTADVVAADIAALDVVATIAEPASKPQAKADSLAYSVAKRVFDLTLSTLALLVAGPLMALIAIAVRLESKGPVLFGHVRLGKHGNYFRCYKFRTMRPTAQSELLADPELRRIYEENDFKIPLERDPRITRFGRFLRKSSLDELPQFFNVISGSTSLVGPRPIVPDELHWYNGSERLFLSVRPGIFGVWQVQGRNRIGYPQRTQVELDAIRSRSIWQDVKVLATAVPAVITSRGSL
jgi:lipopolysaccharide/colanic/teichoic acid biosynthesis glycosyltransferase